VEPKELDPAERQEGTLISGDLIEKGYSFIAWPTCSMPRFFAFHRGCDCKFQ
jgi:hypothetical protein